MYTNYLSRMMVLVIFYSSGLGSWIDLGVGYVYIFLV